MKIDFKNFKFKDTPLHSATAVLAALALAFLLIWGTHTLCTLPKRNDVGSYSSTSDSAALKAEMDKLQNETSSQNGEVAQ